MNNQKRKDEAAHDLDADLAKLLAEAGLSPGDGFLSSKRIEQIAATDTDEEKRQLAERLLNMQNYAKSLANLKFFTHKHAPGCNVFNPLAPLAEGRLVRLSDLQGNSGSPESGD